jgi:hypothetical protein
LGALVGPVWSPSPRAPDPTLPTAVWPCLLPAGHSHHRDRGDSRRSGDRSGWWCGGCGPGAECDVRPIDSSWTCAAIRPTLRWSPRHRSSTAWRGSVRQQQGRRRRSWQTTFDGEAPQRRATSLRWLSGCLGLHSYRPLRLPSGGEAVRLVSLRVSALFSTARSPPYHAVGVRRV